MRNYIKKKIYFMMNSNHPRRKRQKKKIPKKEKIKKRKESEVNEDNIEELIKKGNPHEFTKLILNNSQLDSIWFKTS